MRQFFADFDRVIEQSTTDGKDNPLFIGGELGHAVDNLKIRFAFTTAACLYGGERFAPIARPEGCGKDVERR